MAKECGFFNAQLVGEEFDRVYLAEQFAAYFASFVGNGVFGKSMQKLEVVSQTTPDMSVKVLSGEAWINGWWYRDKETFTLSLDVADGVLDRIDAIVLRWGNAERDMWLQVIKGTASANPVAPTIRRDADYYDLQLATVSVQHGAIRITQSAITDTRLVNAVCGLVTGVIDQIDTTDLYNQFTAYFNEFKATYESDFDTWSAEQKAAYLDFVNGKTSDYNTFVANTEAAYTQFTNEQRNKYNQWYDTHTTAWQAEFEAWFANLKDILSGDVAGNLQLEIEDLQKQVLKLNNFARDLVYKQEVYPVLLDTSYNTKIGELTTSANQIITTSTNQKLDIISDGNEPILDSNNEYLRGIIKFAIL